MKKKSKKKIAAHAKKGTKKIEKKTFFPNFFFLIRRKFYKNSDPARWIFKTIRTLVIDLNKCGFPYVDVLIADMNEAFKMIHAG